MAKALRLIQYRLYLSKALKKILCYDRKGNSKCLLVVWIHFTFQ
jgi:hypothetical protein